MLKKVGVFALIFIGIIFCSVLYASTTLTYQYDANGNLISGDGRYYEYNDANQLVKVKYGDQNGPVIAEYFYDYAGQRIKKIENGVTTYYIGKHFETQTDGLNTQHTSYYFANGERVAKKDVLGNISYYHSDHLGGTNVVTDSSGNLVERIRYFPFGEIREGGNEKYSFTGKEKDKLTDNYYFEARYYNPDFKHFTQADSVEPDYYNPQDLNRYSYAGNNPIIYIDPSGHEKQQHHLSGREKWMIAHGVDPDHDKTSLKNAKALLKAGGKYMPSAKSYYATKGSSEYTSVVGAGSGGDVKSEIAGIDEYKDYYESEALSTWAKALFMKTIGIIPSALIARGKTTYKEWNYNKENFLYRATGGREGKSHTAWDQLKFTASVELEAAGDVLGITDICDLGRYIFSVPHSEE